MTPEEAIENLNKVVVYNNYHTGHKDYVRILRGIYIFNKTNALQSGLHYMAELEELNDRYRREQVPLADIRLAGAEVYTKLCMEGTV